MCYRTLLLTILCNFYFCFNIYSQTLQWRTLPNSPSAGISRLDDVFFVNVETGWTISSEGRVFRTTNGGGSWDTALVSADGLRSIGFFDPENGILGTLSTDSNKVMYRTTNHGVNWSVVTNFPAPWPMGICGIFILNENSAIACGRFSLPARIVKTTDKGATWTASLVDTSLANALVDCYFWDENNGIAVGGHSSTGSFIGSFSVVLKTTDGGSTWVRVFRSPRQFEQCWKISYRPGGSVFVSVERYGSGISNILKSTDLGSQWSEIPFRTYREQGIGFINENTGWIGGQDLNNYETTNGGGEWHLAGWGFRVNRIRFLNDTLAYAAGQRVYKFSRETVGINFISGVIPVSYSLKQNYPNPFNPVTKIKFDIPSDVKGQQSNVKMTVFDVMGREVMTIVNEKLSPGSYEADFDGSNFPSGIYFYKLEAGSFVETKRMVMLK